MSVRPASLGISEGEYHEGSERLMSYLFDHDLMEAVFMVFSIEPGISFSKLGGFRHSDTVAVIEDGIEIMTHYPRDLESLTNPI